MIGNLTVSVVYQLASYGIGNALASDTYEVTPTAEAVDGTITTGSGICGDSGSGITVFSSNKVH